MHAAEVRRTARRLRCARNGALLYGIGTKVRSTKEKNERPPTGLCDIEDHVMSRLPADDPVLKRFRTALDPLYGDRIERVVLFGSRARSDAHDDSDYDIAVFLRDLTDRWQEFDRLADLRCRFLADPGVFIDAKPYPAGAHRDRTPLMGEIRHEGVDL
jgi:uncharacterized protein